MNEGYIKFNIEWERSISPDKRRVEELNAGRDLLYKRGLIGMYENGIGYGNISLRTGEKEFVISGSATGGIERLMPTHYTRVTDYDMHNNYIKCEGPLRASSESMTHAAIYTAVPECLAVAHAHHLDLWRELLGEMPTTSDLAEYGTPELAVETLHLAKKSETRRKQLIVLGGHREGIISFGASPLEAAEKIVEEYDRFRIKRGL
jgi:hypothetical protein